MAFSSLDFIARKSRVIGAKTDLKLRQINNRQQRQLLHRLLDEKCTSLAYLICKKITFAVSAIYKQKPA